MARLNEAAGVGADVGADSVARFDRSGMLRMVAGVPRRQPSAGRQRDRVQLGAPQPRDIGNSHSSLGLSPQSVNPVFQVSAFISTASPLLGKVGTHEQPLARSMLRALISLGSTYTMTVAARRRARFRGRINMRPASLAPINRDR